MAVTTRIHATEAKAGFADFLRRAQAGEQFVILRNGKEAAILAPIASATATAAQAAPEAAKQARPAREPGQAKPEQPSTFHALAAELEKLYDSGDLAAYEAKLDALPASDVEAVREVWRSS